LEHTTTPDTVAAASEVFQANERFFSIQSVSFKCRKYGVWTNICSDKTGTLTQVKVATSIWMLEVGEDTVAGQGYAMQGVINSAQGRIVNALDDVNFCKLMERRAFCHMMNIVEATGKVWADPTEIALGEACFAEMAQENPFSSDTDVDEYDFPGYLGL